MNEYQLRKHIATLEWDLGIIVDEKVRVQKVALLETYRNQLRTLGR